MQPHAEINQVYDRPLTQSSNITVETVATASKAVTWINSAIESLIQEKRVELGVAHIKPIDLSIEKAEELRQAIRKDSRWLEGFKALIGVLAPESYRAQNLEGQVSAIQIPWWTTANILRDTDRYNPADDSLAITGRVSHPYITQLRRSNKLPAPTTLIDPMSISGVLLTSDDLLVLGVRAGHTYRDTIMTIPAGFVEPSGAKNPLFNTFYRELAEEIGLSVGHISSAEFIGRVTDHEISKNTSYVVRARTNLSYAQVFDGWMKAIDNREHKFLYPITDNPGDVVKMLQRNKYNPGKALPENPARTTIDNVNTLLPPGIISILLHYVQRLGSSWGREAQELLNGEYRLV